MKGGWRSLLDIYTGEGRVVSVLLIHSLFMGLSLVFFETASSALFLARFPAEGLPYTFIGTAFLVPLSGVVYNRLRNRLSTTGLWAGTLLFLLAVPLGATALLHVTRAAWPTLILMVLVNALYALTALEFWGLAGRVLSLRQARRLYGLIGSGEVAAGIVGGVAVVPMLKIVSVTNLLLVAAIGFFVCLLCLFDLLRVKRERSEDTEEEEEDESTNQSVIGLLRAVTRDLYILLIVGLYLFYNLTHDTLEYTNLSQIQAYFRQNENQVAGFIGVLLSAREIITLVVRTFLSSRLLSRFGLGAGLAATPTLMMAGSASLVAISLAAPRLPLFWVVVFLKIAEGTVRNSLSKPAIMMAYRPLAPQRRDRAQIVIETAIEPLSTGLTGAILLLVNFILAGATPARKAIGAGVLMFTTAGGWLVMARLLRREYTSVVMKALSRGSLRAVVLTFDDSTIAALTSQLRSCQAVEVIYLLSVLRQNMPADKYSGVLSGLRDHPAPEVRAAVAGHFEKLHSPSSLTALSEQLAVESVPAVRVALLSALAAGGNADAIAQISPFLDNSSLPVRRAALAGLLKYGRAGEALRAGELLSRFLESPEPSERVVAAEVVGELGIQNYLLPFRQLLADPDNNVRLVALEAASRSAHAGLWPQIVRQLTVPQIWQHASRALTLGGDSAISPLGAMLREPSSGCVARRRAIRILGRIGTPAAATALRPYIQDPELRQLAVRALQDCHYQAAGAFADETDVEFRREAERASWLMSAAVDAAKSDNAAVLQQALNQEIGRSRDILFSLLAFLYHPDSMRKARTYWRSGSPEKKAFALEVLDNLCDRRHKKFFMPLVEDLPPDEAHRRLNAHFPQPLLGPEARLKEIVNAHPPWATHWIGVWAKRALDQNRQDAGRSTMLSTIEKILLLKSVEFFLTTDDDVLVELAALATEVPVKAGEKIVQKGKVESTMYLMASGSVRVHDGDQSLAQLGRGAVFGELAALDSQPRTADVTALTDVTLLRIDNSTLVDLMAEHIEVAHGIIRFLIRRYRPPGVVRQSE